MKRYHLSLSLLINDVVLIISIFVQDSTGFGELGSGNLSTLRASRSDIASVRYESQRSRDQRNERLEVQDCTYLKGSGRAAIDCVTSSMLISISRPFESFGLLKLKAHNNRVAVKKRPLSAT